MAGTTDRTMDELGGQRYSNVMDALNSINHKMGRLDDIDANLQRLMQGKGFQSQGNARDTRDQGRRPFGEHHANRGRGYRDAGKGFTDAFEKALFEGLGGSHFKDRIKESLSKFAEAMDTDLEHLQEEFGEQLGRTVANTVKNDKGIGGTVYKKVTSIFDKFMDNDKGVASLLRNMKQDPGYDFGKMMRDLKGLDLGTVGNAFKGVFTTGIEAIDRFAGGTVAATVAAKVLEDGLEGAAEALEGFDKMLQILEISNKRFEITHAKNTEAANKRLQEDVRTLVEQPFKILKDAAQEVYNAWNANIRLVTGTQGYTKADLQDLMAAYSARIQSEGLSNVIPATDIYNNLAKVIQAGLTGTGAVEFAYQATKYGAAIPSQDFFGYVETYASVVANAIQAGKSEAEALQIANRSLEDFANNLLYASRELTGGYGTGLKAADSIYNASVKIAQAAKSENINQISSSLLAIQGYVGAIAPDLATNLSDKIYQLVTGGNASDIVALRSLAGINASNTEFIRAFSENPQAVLANMFASLGKMYTQSPDAYMEKAEGYASLFGLSSEAFQRIDFIALSNAIINMSDNSNSLDQNMKLLKEGQTTTSTDQLKIAQINKYIIEEGLAYVIDNEAAQMIQQHMWDEQLAREITESEFGVNLIGDSATALQKIISGIDNVIGIINPFKWIQRISSVIQTVAEGFSVQEDVKEVLERSLVGAGNARDLYNLTNRNENLRLTQTLVELMGGTSHSTGWRNGRFSPILYGLGNPLQSVKDLIKLSNKIGATGTAAADMASEFGARYTPSSQYTWGSISKSAAYVAQKLLKQGTFGDYINHQVVTTASGAVSASAAAIKTKVDKMFSAEYLDEQFLKKGKTYDEWLASAKDLGITDAKAAFESAGYKTEDVEEYFRQKETEAGQAEKLATAEQEKLFRETGINFWNIKFWDEFNSPLTTKFDASIALQQAQLSKLDVIAGNQINWKEYFATAWVEQAWNTGFLSPFTKLSELFTSLVSHFLDRSVYHEAYKYDDVLDVQRRENAERGDAVYALADALTDNMVDLKDPQLQTNAILSQILIVVSAIMNQNNTGVGTMSIADTLAGMALGLTTKTSLGEPTINDTSATALAGG